VAASSAGSERGGGSASNELYGFDLPAVGPRIDALEEQMQIVRGHWGPGPFSFEGKHFRAKDLDARPKPIQQPRPPLILGGRGGPRSLRLAARYADEYNCVMAVPEDVADIRARLDQACEAEGRDPAGLPLSMMTTWMVGADADDLRERAGRLSEWKGEDGDGDALLSGLRPEAIKGTVPEATLSCRSWRRSVSLGSWASICFIAISLPSS
jgi:alkanesulfonate monooxygenase SsuD/methylene tetrahydromethanopterin reductase-like flavin-dependent oxidoreductase (luciferase family)